MAAFAAVFDLDGTLLDTLGDLTAAVNSALERLSCPPRTREEVRAFIGNGVPTLLRRSLPAEADDALHRQAMAYFSEYYGLHMTDTTAPYPGIPWLLERLARDGVRLGVVSNKKHDATQPLCRRWNCWTPTRRTPYTSATRTWTCKPPARPAFPAARSAGAIGRPRSCGKTAPPTSAKPPKNSTSG